jgi:hypothetical protein
MERDPPALMRDAQLGGLLRSFLLRAASDPDMPYQDIKESLRALLAAELFSSQDAAQFNALFSERIWAPAADQLRQLPSVSDVRAGVQGLLHLFSRSELAALVLMQPALLQAQLLGWLAFFNQYGFSEQQVRAGCARVRLLTAALGVSTGAGFLRAKRVPAHVLWLLAARSACCGGPVGRRVRCSIGDAPRATPTRPAAKNPHQHRPGRAGQGQPLHRRQRHPALTQHWVR